MGYFSPIIGQDKAVELLKRAVDGNTISHAYLFIGPAGIGKMMTAKAFAYSLLNMTDSSAAVYLQENQHPDLLIIEKAEDKTVISKEQITSDLEPWLALKPYRAQYRIVIIKDAHLLSNEAANALLKTLEEPPLYAVIILVADESNLLETIVSRCQLIRFFSVPDILIEEYLINQGVEAKKAAEAARLGQGSIADARRFAEEDSLQGGWELARDIVKKLARQQIIEVYNSAEKMETDPELITRMMETILRDIYIFKETAEKKLLAIPENAELAAAISFLPEGVRQAINEINLLKSYYRRNINSLIISINICYAVYAGFEVRQ